ncbi:hypothetical protein U1Q18_015405 [Sarracenia purpurea var. burkii]
MLPYSLDIPVEQSNGVAPPTDTVSQILRHVFTQTQMMARYEARFQYVQQQLHTISTGITRIVKGLMTLAQEFRRISTASSSSSEKSDI